MTEWGNLHEPLARIYQAVKRSNQEFKELGYTEYDIVDDDEVRPELINLIRIMLEEIEDDL